MIHLFFILTPSLHDPSKQVAWQAQAKGWSSLEHGLRKCSLNFPSRRSRKYYFEDFAGRYSPNASLLSMRSVLQSGGPVLLPDCPMRLARLQLLWIHKPKMKSMLGLRARTQEPSPLEGSGAFRALQIETDLRQLTRSEWWLWFSASAVTLLAISALLLSFLPSLFRNANHFYEIRSDQTQWGTAALVLVFNSWLVYRQWSFRRRRKELTAQNPFPERSASEFADPSGFDPVTGLYTRVSIEQQLGKEIGRARRENTSLSIATIHIDEFAQITQRYGKAAVDSLLKEFARRLKKAIRGSDFAVRLGSADFLLILTECTLGEVKHILNRIGPLEIVSAGEKVPIPYSTGWVDYQGGELPSDLLKRATQILHLYENASKDSLSATQVAR
jgi:diguanylate cyclase (GGDEF)-like protein